MHRFNAIALDRRRRGLSDHCDLSLPPYNLASLVDERGYDGLHE